jgi:hypothetical protein
LDNVERELRSWVLSEEEWLKLEELEKVLKVGCFSFHLLCFIFDKIIFY